MTSKHHFRNFFGTGLSTNEFFFCEEEILPRLLPNYSSSIYESQTINDSNLSSETFVSLDYDILLIFKCIIQK